MSAATVAVVPRSRSWIAGDDVIADLKIENRDARPLEVPDPMFSTSPQPIYTVKTPAGDVTFARSSGRDEKPVAPRLLRIEPGETWQGDLVVSWRADTTTPGDYEIGATLEWAGVRLVAPPAPFRIDAPRFERMALSLGRGESGGVGREVLLLHRGPDGPEVIMVRADETNPTLGEMELKGRFRRGRVADGTLELLGPYANYAFPSEPTRWNVVVTASAIEVSNRGVPVAKVTSPRRIRQVLTPLAVRDPALSVLAILEAAGGAELGLARLTPGGTAPVPAKKPATTRLSRRFDPDEVYRAVPAAAEGGVPTFALRPVAKLARPSFAASTLAPHALGSELVVASIARKERGGGALLELLRIDGEGNVGGRGEKAIDGLAPEPPLALHVDATGCVRAAFVAREIDHRERLHLVEAIGRLSWGAFDETHVLDTIEIGKRPIVDALVAYHEREPGAVTRAALVRLASGRDIVIDEAGTARDPCSPIRQDAQLALVPGRGAWYVVEATLDRVDVAGL